MRPDRFVSCARSAGDLAGVFEFDGETGYFYLYALEARDAEPIRGAIHVCSAPADFAESEVAVRWNPTETAVGLFIRGVLWAAFEPARNLACGGGYAPSARPTIHAAAAMDFA